MLSKRAKDVHRCLKQIDSFSNNQASVVDWDSDMLRWMKLCLCPKEGPYEGGKFTFVVSFGKHYPKTAPSVSCLTPIYHPNIDADCEEYNVCLSLLDEWQESFGLEDLIQGLLFLMYNPNLEDPLSPLFDGDLDYESFVVNVRKSLRGEIVEGIRFAKMIDTDGSARGSRSQTVDGIVGNLVQGVLDKIVESAALEKELEGANGGSGEVVTNGSGGNIESKSTVEEIEEDTSDKKNEGATANIDYEIRDIMELMLETVVKVASELGYEGNKEVSVLSEEAVGGISTVSDSEGEIPRSKSCFRMVNVSADDSESEEDVVERDQNSLAVDLIDGILSGIEKIEAQDNDISQLTHKVEVENIGNESAIVNEECNSSQNTDNLEVKIEDNQVAQLTENNTISTDDTGDSRLEEASSNISVSDGVAGACGGAVAPSSNCTTEELRRIAFLLDELLKRAEDESAQSDTVAEESAHDVVVDSESDSDRERDPADQGNCTRNVLLEIQSALNHILPVVEHHHSREAMENSTTDRGTETEDTLPETETEAEEEDLEELEPPVVEKLSPIPIPDILQKVEAMLKDIEENGEPVEENGSDSEDTFFSDGSFEEDDVDFGSEDDDESLYSVITPSRLHSMVEERERKQDDERIQAIKTSIYTLLTTTAALFCHFVDITTMFKL